VEVKRNLKKAVRAELIEVLYKNLTIGLACIFLMASLIVWQINTVAYNSLLLDWYLCLSINMILGNLLIIWYKKTKHDLSLMDYHFYLYLVGATFTAILLGILASILMPHNLTQQMLVIVMVVCITSGSIQSMHSSYLASIMYLLFSLLPLLVWAGIQSHNNQAVYLSVLVAIFFYTMYLIAEIYRGHTTITKNIELKLQNILNNRELKKQKDEIEYLSKHDSITNLYNRRYLEHVVANFQMKLANQKQPISIFMFDIDHFKNINDFFGHEMGDIVLQKCGNLIRRFFTETNLIFRYGGDEFLIISEGFTLEESYQRAIEFQQYLKQSHIITKSENTQITISGGVATFPVTSKDMYFVINEADKALYQAKNKGRDKIERASTQNVINRV